MWQYGENGRMLEERMMVALKTDLLTKKMLQARLQLKKKLELQYKKSLY
jgi:hypothetical protein